MSQNDPGRRTAGARSLAREEEIRELLESAGRRPEAPRHDLAMIRAAARADWQELVATRRRRRLVLRRLVPLAAATSLILAVAAGWWWMNQRPAVSTPIATVALLEGDVQVQGTPDRTGEGRRELAVGDALVPGMTLATAGRPSPGIVTLALASGESVRLDAATTVRLATGRRLALDSGTLYVDSGGTPVAGDPLEIVTPGASVRELGTQFEVRVTEGEDVALRVRVREGAVEVADDVGSHAVAMGQELRLHRDGSISRRAVAPYGPAWSWTLAAAPAFDTDGRTLASFLDWVCRETGWRLRYADEELARSATENYLSGDIEGLTPDEAVTVMLQASGLDFDVEDGTLWVTRTGS